MRRLLMFFVAMAVGMTTTWAQNFDLNGDGLVNSADVVHVYNYIINGESGDSVSGMDLNGDGIVNSADVTCLYNVITNKDDSGNDGEFTVKGVSFKMVAVEGGTFLMGGTSEQGSDVESNEKPVHSVTLSSYYIGQTEVTSELWNTVMEYSLEGSNKPISGVTWNDCQKFIGKLNALTGKQFRLPTEAEWEYACRGGNKSMGYYKYSGSKTIDEVGWHIGNSYNLIHIVATKQPNELGIYDMCGNLAEWCQDWFGEYDSSSVTNPMGPTSGTKRVWRGGSFMFSAIYCRSSCRNGYPPTAPAPRYLGLRLALSK